MGREHDRWLPRHSRATASFLHRLSRLAVASCQGKAVVYLRSRGVHQCCLVTLQRLLESTFRLDIAAAREYCEADDRWARATAFLAANGAAGWSLIEVRSPSVRGFVA